jgi:tetratricopeptide (TPR) repeat protein
VPADKILDILASDDARAYEARFVAHFLAERGDFKGAESKFRESISILERVAPESSQLVTTLRDFAAMLQKAKRLEDAKKVLAKADSIASKPVSTAPQP